MSTKPPFPCTKAAPAVTLHGHKRGSAKFLWPDYFLRTV